MNARAEFREGFRQGFESSPTGSAKLIFEKIRGKCTKAWHGFQVWLGQKDSVEDKYHDIDDNTERLERWRTRMKARSQPKQMPEKSTQAIVHVPTKLAKYETPRKSSDIFLYLILALVTVFAAYGIFAMFKSFNHPVERSEQATSPAAAVPVAVAAETWKLEYSDYSNNRWFADGITEIQNASTDEEAAEAAQIWLDEVKPDPNLLAAAAKAILDRDIDKTTLFKDGWATQDAVQLVAEMQLALGKAQIVAEDAPTNGTNSGVSNGIVVSSRTAGVSGNRKSIKITFADGRVIWVLARCGNVVTTSHPYFPPGETDEKPGPKLEPKDPSKDPYPQGNAPVGGGKNQDPGPGTYITPEEMEKPPATPRVNPAPPLPTTKEGTVKPPVGSIPDPTPPPAPEPQAPTPEEPAAGTVNPPGL